MGVLYILLLSLSVAMSQARPSPIGSSLLPSVGQWQDPHARRPWMNDRPWDRHRPLSDGDIIMRILSSQYNFEDRYDYPDTDVHLTGHKRSDSFHADRITAALGQLDKGGDLLGNGDLWKAVALRSRDATHPVNPGVRHTAVDPALAKALLRLNMERFDIPQQGTDEKLPFSIEILNAGADSNSNEPDNTSNDRMPVRVKKNNALSVNLSLAVLKDMMDTRRSARNARQLWNIGK